MPPLSLLIKPASGNCNMRCRYCFYADEARHREFPMRGIMSQETMMSLIDRALSYAEGECTFAFQGGEPTLAGLPFFRAFVERVSIHPSAEKLHIQYALQTNGCALNEEWAEWLAEHRVLVGMSLDGPKDAHDRYRVDADGKGTFDRVMDAIRLLEAYGVEYNILTVVHGGNVRRAQRLYRFFKDNGYCYQQYIECLDPIGLEPGKQEHSLTPEKYGIFLKQLFDMWYHDLSVGKPVYNRYFENLLMILLGQEPESCNMRGMCGKQWVIEADGSVYPCDFYALDEWRLGNIASDSFEKMDAMRTELRFVEASLRVPDECGKCRWYPLCGCGCRRNRVEMSDGSLGKNYFCAAYSAFFEYAYPRLMKTLENKLGGEMLF